MLGAKLLDQAGLLSRYSSFPPHLPGLVYPLYGLERIDKLSLEGEYIHKSDNPFLFPHRVRLCNTRESTPKMTIGDHIWVHLPAITTRKLLENACSYVIDGWIVGVHFDEYGTTEFTVIGMFQHVLQVIFLSVPHAFVDRPRSPPFTMRHAGTCYWTYMSVPEVEARALNVQGIERGKIADWSPSYPVVQGHMRLLRCSSVFYFPLIDHQFFKPTVMHPNLVLPEDVKREVIERSEQMLGVFTDPISSHVEEVAEVAEELSEGGCLGQWFLEYHC